MLSEQWFDLVPDEARQQSSKKIHNDIDYELNNCFHLSSVPFYKFLLLSSSIWLYYITAVKAIAALLPAELHYRLENAC